MKAFQHLISAGLTLLTLCVVPAQAPAQDQHRPIQIVTALYGRRGDHHPVDFTARLQQTCGVGATYCEAFCSPAFIGARRRGHVLFSAPPVCRVTYRCGDHVTQTAETEQDDTILLTCRPG